MGFRYRLICLAAVIIPLMSCSSTENKSDDPPVSKTVDSPPPSSSDAAEKKSPDTSVENLAKEETPEEKEDNIETPQPPPVVNVDPYEKFNRAVFGFNMRMDRYILRPIAQGYDTITPSPIRKGIGNFFSNLDMLNTIPNDLLQGKTAYFTADTWRFILNTTLGLGGVFDVATRFGLPQHHEDFGLTLAYWSGESGLKPQPYLVLPIMGSSTTRDTFGRLPSYATWPFTYMDPQYYNYGALALNAVNKRADLLPADKLLQDAFDPYIFVRDAYLQTRNHAIEINRHETNFPPYTTETEPPPSENDNTGNEL
jgi:phospholipid-binding lipoprotein MlaA